MFLFMVTLSLVLWKIPDNTTYINNRNGAGMAIMKIELGLAFSISRKFSNIMVSLTKVAFQGDRQSRLMEFGGNHTRTMAFASVPMKAADGPLAVWPLNIASMKSRARCLMEKLGAI